MGSRGAGRGLKRFLEAVGFILAEFGPKPSHGDPIRDQNYGFGTSAWHGLARHGLAWHSAKRTNIVLYTDRARLKAIGVRGEI